MESIRRWISFRRVTIPMRADQLAFVVTELIDDCYRRTMAGIVISLGTPRSAGQIIGCTGNHLGALATRLRARVRRLAVQVPLLGAQETRLGGPVASLGALASSLEAPVTSLGAPVTTLGALATNLGAPHIMVEQSGKNFVRNAPSLPGNHSDHLLFNNCYNSSIHVVFSSMYLSINVSMYLYSYTSTYHITGLDADGA
jgi:hypothetical protein